MKRIAYLVAVLAGISTAHAMGLSSPDLKDGAKIGLMHVYTRCGGQNLSPALSWNGLPDGTKSIAVTLIDQSVKPSGWTHWIVLGLPPSTTTLPRGVATLPAGARQIVTDFGDAQYDGPCPPPGSGEHRYQFTVWALGSAAPVIANGETAAALSESLSRAALAKASIMVTYQR